MRRIPFLTVLLATGACASNQQIDEVTPRQREIFGANPSIIFVLPPVDDQIATHPQVAKLY